MSQGEKISTPLPSLSLLFFMYFCLTEDTLKIKKEDGTTKARTCSYILQEPWSLANRTQPRLKTPLELQQPAQTRGNLRGSGPCAKQVSPSLRPGHQARASIMMPCSRSLLFPTETDTLSSRWPADCLYQLLPLRLASPSHSQLVWGITLQKKEADWFDSPLGNKTSLQPRKHDLQRMTEGTRLFSLAKTEDRHDNYL